MFLFEERWALHGTKRVINICVGTIKTLRGMCDAMITVSRYKRLKFWWIYDDAIK